MTRAFAGIDDVEVRGRRVLLRVDFNVPQRGGVIADDARMRAALPTIRELQSSGGRIIIVTHLGRPRGAIDESLRTAPLAAHLATLLGTPVGAAHDVVGPDARRRVAGMRDGDVVMLENVRFEPGEERDDPAFATALAGLAEVYVNDAFGAAHRAHASTEGVAHHLPAVAGRLMQRELEVLGSVLDDPARPLLAILGGSKISSKLGVLRSLLPRVDALWVGGAMACTFLRAQGMTTGRSLVEEDQVAVARDLLTTHGERLHLPIDVVVAAAPDAGPGTVVEVDAIPADRMVVDVGPQTVARIGADAGAAGTVVWNGPLGIYEVEAFAAGTRETARLVAATRAVTVVGGGDLGAAVRDAGVADRITHISTGGGATLEFLEGRALPGVTALAEPGTLRHSEVARG